MSELFDDDLRLKCAEAAGPNLYMIEKRGLYYRPGAKGYTASMEEAWKLPLSEAKKYGMYSVREGVLPEDIVRIVPAPIPPLTLDWCASLRALLTEEEREEFAKNLLDIVEPKWWCDTNARPMWKVADATARQICVAFLRAKGAL